IRLATKLARRASQAGQSRRASCQSTRYVDGSLADMVGSLPMVRSARSVLLRGGGGLACPDQVHDPGHHLGEDGGVQGVDNVLAFAPVLHQPRLFQDSQVMAHARLADGETGGNLAGREIPLGQHAQDLAADGIGQGFEHLGEGHGCPPYQDRYLATCRIIVPSIPQARATVQARMEEELPARRGIWYLIPRRASYVEQVSDKSSYKKEPFRFATNLIRQVAPSR